MYLPSVFKNSRLIRYKYVKRFTDIVIYELIQRPKIHVNQASLNRNLIIEGKEWTGKVIQVKFLLLIILGLVCSGVHDGGRGALQLC